MPRNPPTLHIYQNLTETTTHTVYDRLVFIFCFHISHYQGNKAPAVKVKVF